MSDFNNFENLVETIYNHLKNTKVYSLTPRAGAILNFALSLVDKNLSLPQGMMMGIGASIYNHSDSLDQNNISMGTAALLGHETVHGIQSLSAGGIINFMENYIAAGLPTKDNRSLYYTNKFERAAYSFGPENYRGWRESNAKRSGASEPVLLDPNNSGWWEL